MAEAQRKPEKKLSPRKLRKRAKDALSIGRWIAKRRKKKVDPALLQDLKVLNETVASALRAKDADAIRHHGERLAELIQGKLKPHKPSEAWQYIKGMLIFGGITTANNYDNDVWSLALDGPAVWQRVVVPGPAPRGRQSPVAVYDAERGRLIVHGGYDGTYLIRDAWELSLAGEPQWRELEPDGNVPIFWFDHAAVLDLARERMVIFGDFGSWSLDWTPAGPGRSLSSLPRAGARPVIARDLPIAVASAGSRLLRGSWDLRIQLPEPGRAMLEVRAVTGRLVFAREIAGGSTGSSTINIPESASYPSGIYFLKLTQGSRVARAKVVSLR